MENAGYSRDDDIGFWKNLILTTVFFLVAPVTLAVSLFSLYSLRKNYTAANGLASKLPAKSYESGYRVYASLPMKLPSVSENILYKDARSEILKQYMEKYSSPLVPYAELVVQVADKYSIDFRLITAIAQQESNLCKVIPPGSYNCWGWGITSESSLGFSSYEEGIETVSKGLRENYLNKGYINITDIMSKYTPLSNGSWAAAVEKFMSIMQ